jgi:hypothetical protein
VATNRIQEEVIFKEPAAATSRRDGVEIMEHLWSPAVATGRNLSQIRAEPQLAKHPQTVACGCRQLPLEAHGKEGVDG